MRSSVLDLIGNTPLLSIRWAEGCEIFAKAEFLNPGGSVKDRPALHMINKAEERGDLRPGMAILEATSGNTGIGVALVGRLKGYPVRIVMSASMSDERKKIIRALGAELIETPARDGVEGSVQLANEMAASDPNAWLVHQFDNPDNAEIHYLTTGPEIWEQMDGRVDAFVTGIGSGGTCQGVGSFLREKNPDIKIIAVEPEGHSALLQQEPGLHTVHQIQGIGDGFVPNVLDVNLINEIITVYDSEAVQITRGLATSHGILVGTSSGANVFGAVQMMKKLGPKARIVTVLPDRAERYFSTSLL